METAPAQDFALGTNQVVALIGDVPGGNQVGLLPGMDGNVGRDVPFLKQLSKLSLAVPGVSGQRYGLQRELLN